ncbi:hypothetical protein P153DRAFT_334222 [Dothidotthia symphoricarpi CBS 119687]|uniref:Uncharacterized protein n=1 Tax=Dothidotthia symphoricarpi CBS 119687 TaxID=1392245 RepID=A0A6A6AJ03_9PLEO|nr:uncharacterized protein P153DRAFT_334222 [Dothidotthia symphoricarpi CBS 119687]KAF2131919.1 hypothetical protein P153DRAFT_334222 [Dothidotthia symphoricarpi CBS 119687]
MSLDPNDFQLKHTNVSRPQLLHSDSHQSVASQSASEGYYSASEKASGASSSSNGRTPRPDHELPASDAHLTSLRGVGIPRQQERAAAAAPHQPRMPQPRTAMDPDSQATTPGQDTTPYIRFAIDQLTRDEEVRGSRVYPEVRPAVVAANDDEDYPVERIVPDHGLGYTQPRATPHVSPNAPRQQPLRSAEGRKPVPTPKLVHANKPGHSQKPVHAQQPVQTQQPVQAQQPAHAQMPMYAPMPMPTQQPSHALKPAPAQLYTPLPQSQARPASPQTHRDVFVALDQPPSPLRFRPAIIRTVWLGIFTFLCAVMLAALIFAAIYSNRNGGVGLWDYVQFGDGRYFVFQYLPTLLGMLILLWLIQVQTALQRIVPFISMASESSHQRSQSAFLQLYPTQFLLPNLEHFRAGRPLVGVCYVVFWLFSWTIPLLAACFNVRYNQERRVWVWVAVQGVIWTVVVLYILLILALVYLTVFLMRVETGLRWDPRSLADIISLFERSNVTADYNGSETFQKGDWDQIRARTDRIGYWRTTNRPKDIFYGIGKEGGLTRRFTLEEGRIKEKSPERVHGSERPTDYSIRMDIRDSDIRLKYLPWYLKDTMVIAWIVTAVVLLIAFLVVSFIKQNVRLGFLSRVEARTNAAGFSASNFVYSFIPALIGHFLFLAFLSLDYSIRVLQPYIALSSTGGATAETSLLVDYACRLPLSVTLSAAENKHFQTAILSLISLTSISIPIIAGGCFWTQYYNSIDNVRVAADLPAYYALCFFLVLYTLGLFTLIPNRHRAALPHQSASLADITSWIYQSPLLTDRAFASPHTKPDLVARLMGTAYFENTWTRSVASLVRPSRSNLRADSPTDPALHAEKERRAARGTEESDTPGRSRYGFGIHVGRDGLEHLGIDRVQRGGDRAGRPLVIFEEQRRQKRKSWSEQV